MIALVVGVSRVFLGIHFPQDVFGGWLIGLVLLGIALVVLKRLDERRLPARTLWAAVLLAPITLAVVHPTRETVLAMGSLWGLGIGYLLERRLIGFSPRTAWTHQLAKIGVGGVVLFGLWLGLKAILPEAYLFRFLRYSIVGLWGTFLAPWVFVKTGWAEAGRGED